MLGNGQLANLPSEAQDIRFYWRNYFTALIKYLKVAGARRTENARLAVHAATVDPDNLFFDSIGAGQFEIAEYVDRRFVTASQDPIRPERRPPTCGTASSTTTTFSRDIYRGETAIYTADDRANVGRPSRQGGQRRSSRTCSVARSSQAGWSDVLDASGNVAYSAYSTARPARRSGQLPGSAARRSTVQRQRSSWTTNGLPRLFAATTGAIGGAATPFTLGPTPIKITQTYPNIQSAMIAMPIVHEPVRSAEHRRSRRSSVLIPWVPKQPGVGFPIALTGTIDKFVSTYQVDFSGTTISANVDYDVVIDPNTHGAQDRRLAPVPRRRDHRLPRPGLPVSGPARRGGLLGGAHVHACPQIILDWFSTHPRHVRRRAASSSRFSPFNNYADYITSASPTASG